MLHDIGKYSTAFQKRLEGSSERVDHTSAGAQESVKKYGDVMGRILAYLIVGHHGGIPDWDDASPYSLRARLEKKDLQNYTDWELEVFDFIKNVTPQLQLNQANEIKKYQIVNRMRMLYSCLVDADFIDTEASFGSPNAAFRGSGSTITDLKLKLEMELERVTKLAPSTNINKWRSRILKECERASETEIGLFSLTVPTGGGKTLSSMQFALKHAVKHGLNRIIYVIPYTSIIEQNARVFKNIFGEENVLEHHSNFDFDEAVDNEKNENSSQKRLRLATQNWDAPIVVTTNVQFFESFFSNKPSKCRKLHNVSKSVVILDEAQMLPLELLKPSVSLLGDLVLNYKTSVVLCTATQPTLNPYFPEKLEIKEIVHSPLELSKVFKRAEVEWVDGDVLKDESLVERIKKEQQVLCIVNTRSHAYKLFAALEDDKHAYHLSARMCGKHRSDVLKVIRSRLTNNQPCRVISTQLIEAGVDVDFPIVFRSLSGMDSIVQSAGRCNREGKLRMGKVYVFEPESHGIPKGYMSRCASKARSIFRQYKEDPIALNAIQHYFKETYETAGEELDAKGIMQLHEEAINTNGIQVPFNEIAQQYKLIENEMRSVIVPYFNDELINTMRYAEHPGGLMKKLQKYTVQVYAHEMIKLEKEKAIETIQEHFKVLKISELYNEDTGLQIPNQNEDLGKLLIF